MSEAGSTGKRGLRAVPLPGSSALPHMPMETKLHAPSLRKEWVERRALVSVLAAAAAKLVLIEAPAGFGKTTLAAQWRASTSEERRFAWVSLDRGDDDPGRLWWYIAHALQRACPGLGVDEVFRALRVPVPDITGTVIPLLVHELAAFGAPVVLVLDDYQLIKEPTCHEQIAFLLLHLPPSAQFVLVTRTDPPLPLARLRAMGEMVEIRTPELRLEPSEAAELVHNVSGLELAEPDLAILLERTEGWPAGLYLAALSLRGHPSPSAFIHQFTGDNRFIVDFLAEEVLSRQPKDIRQFLARTAVLDRFCAPLCDTVTGYGDAAEVIDVLERENLFLVPLDDNRQWYRYHHLFAQVLRGQLARTEPGIGPTLYERASAWHQEHGSTGEAISYALAAGDVAWAVDLIASRWFGFVDSGRVATVRGWMRSLGDSQIAAHALAAHSAAWVAALSGEQGSVRRWLPIILAGEHDGPLPDGMRSLDFSAALLGGAFGFDGIQAMRESAARAVELEQRPYVALVRAGADRARLQPVPFRGARSGGAAQEGNNERGVRPAGAHNGPFRRVARGDRGRQDRASTGACERCPATLGRRRSQQQLRSILSPTRPLARLTCWRGGLRRLAPSSSVRSGHEACGPGSAHGPPWRPCSGSHRSCSTPETALKRPCFSTRPGTY